MGPSPPLTFKSTPGAGFDTLTCTESVAVPDGPSQLILKVELELIVMFWLPDEALFPDQAPDAEQEFPLLRLLPDQEIETVLPGLTLKGPSESLACRLTEGAPWMETVPLKEERADLSELA